MRSRIERILDVLAATSAFVSGAVIVFMMFLVTVDAIGRKFGSPVPGGLEFSEAMMVIVVYLALMAVQRNRENVFVSIATHRLSGRSQARLDALGSAMGFAVFAIFMWVALEKALDAFQSKEFRIAAIAVPVWPFRWFIPVGLALLCVQLLADFVRDWTASRPAQGDHVPEV